MSGTVPEWLFSVCLAVAVLAGFAGGYAWAGVVVAWRRRREAARLQRAFERAQERPPIVLP